MIEKAFAATMLAVCAVLLVRLVLGERRRYRFDAAVRRAWHAAVRGVRGLRRGAARPSAERRARKEADAAIRRARNGSWEGNVFRPSSFGGNGDKRTGSNADDEERRKNLH